MKAAFDAGFSLEPEGVHYHEEITAYRDTAHLRYDGELQGDVLYTFVKKSEVVQKPVADDPRIWLSSYIQNVDKQLGSKEQAVELHLNIIREAAALIGMGKSEDVVGTWLDLLSIIGKSNKAGESVLMTCEGLVSAK